MEPIRITTDPRDFNRTVHERLPEKGDLTIALKTQDGPGYAPVVVAISFTALDTSVDPPREIPVQAVTTGKLFLAAAAAVRGFAELNGKDLDR